MLFVFFCTCGYMYIWRILLYHLVVFFLLVLGFVVEQAGGISYTNESL